MHILSDSGYPLLPFLLTPLLHQPERTPGARYTKHHIQARVVVEWCFGVLKGIGVAYEKNELSIMRRNLLLILFTLM